MFSDNAIRNTSRRNGLLLCVSGVLCVLGPLLAKERLEQNVQVGLADAASESFGVPIRLGHASVGLTGTLEISDIGIGSVFSAEGVTASIVPGSDGSKSLAELEIRAPSLDLRIFPDGTTNIDNFVHKTPTSEHNEGDSSRSSSIGAIRFIGGSVHLELVTRGNIVASDINASIVGDKVHLVSGEVGVDFEHNDWRLRGEISRAALDYQRHGQGLQRLLADGGQFHWRGPSGEAVLQDLVLAHNTGESQWQLRAKTGVRGPTGSIALTGDQTIDGFALEMKLEDAPLSLAGPWLPNAVLPKTTRLSGAISLVKRDKIDADFDLQVQDVEILHSDLAQEAIQMDIDMKGQVKYHRTPSIRYLDAEIARLRTGDLDVMGRATGQWENASAIPQLAQVSLSLSEVDCDSALSSLPPALRPALAGLEMRGKMRSKIDLLMSRNHRSDTSISVSSGIEGCRVVKEPPAADARTLLTRSPSKGTLQDPGKLVHGNPNFSALHTLPSYLPMAFVVAEDARFFMHHGFDLHQIENSLAIDLKSGRFVRGGSTITQQLVKNIFLHRKRSLSRKLQEAVLTWRMDEVVSKKRILEIYLNIIELGDGATYGITAAAQRWFGIPATELSVLQTAFLAAMTPEPSSMSARIRAAGGLDPVSAARIAVILRVMKRGNVISKSEYIRAKYQHLQFTNSAVASR